MEYFNVSGLPNVIESMEINFFIALHDHKSREFNAPVNCKTH